MKSAGRSQSWSGKRDVLVRALACAVAIAVAGPMPEAKAQGYLFGYEAPRKKYKVRRPSNVNAARAETPDDARAGKKKDKSAPDKVIGVKNAKSGPLFAVVSIGDQRVSIYNHDGLVTRSIVSTGMAGHPTPKGVFTIIGRERYHHSNIYSGAPMPYMQRVTWSGVAMHLGVVPGYPASHGCIRLPARFAAELWGLTKIGERVVITPRDVAPREFAHALLPAPKMQLPPVAVAEPGLASETLAGATRSPPATGTQVAAAEAGAAATPAALEPAQPRLLNPIEYARLLKTKATADAAAAAKLVTDTFEAASAKTAESRRAVAELKSAEAAKTKAETRVAAAAKALETASPEGRAAAEAEKAAADTALAEAVKKRDELQKTEAAITAESFEAVHRWKDAKAAQAAASTAGKEAQRRVSPVSVLVSKKDQKVYVRQGLAPLLEAPATIRDPDTPLGTHLYIATAVGDDGASLKWSAISMPVPGGSKDQAKKKKESSRSSRDKEPAPAPVRPASGPAEALERIEMPKDIAERISELIWTGGSMIISDQPLSGETSDEGTDLVVTMRY